LPLIENAISQLHAQLKEKHLDSHLQVTAKPELTGQPLPFSAAIANLIRNACQHAPINSGLVIINLDADAVTISNDMVSNVVGYVPESTTPENGFGFGLDIVERLCARCGWELAISSERGRFIAQLRFAADAAMTS